MFTKKGDIKINPKKYKRLLRKEKYEDFKKLIFFLIVAIVFSGVIAMYQYTIPIYQETREEMLSSLSTMDSSTFLRAGNTDIFDVNGDLLGRIGNEKYKYVNTSEITPYVLKGYIAKEDRNFSMHMGVDIKGTVRAGLAYIAHKGTITQGGSTITQQVVKNNMLTQKQTFKRKITEIFLALQLEKEYNKSQIMEFYCNSNYYGNGCYGIEGASQYYFGHSASNLTLGESAMMVATSNSPNNYNPVANYEKAMSEKESVLSDMLECKYITQEEYDDAVLEKPEIVQKSENVANENYMITYAIHCAALKIMKNDGFKFKYVFETSEEYKEYSEKYSESYNNAVAEVREGGYKIYTSINPKIQKILQESIDKGTKEYKEKQDNGIYSLQSAAVCVDNSNGLVVAIVGGREGKGSYNRGYQSKRQPGSSIKPLIDYGPAYNEGIYTPASVLVDEEVDINGYKPKNAWKGYKGEITTREALLRSYNTIAVKTYMKTSKKVSLSYLEKMKFSSLTYSDMVAPSLAVGGFTTGVSVTDMAKGYATIAMGGNYIDNDCITSLISYTGKQIYKSDKGKKYEVFNADTAFMLTDILSGMFQEDFMPGTKLKKSEQVYMGKTGTTNNNKDAWFCGSSPYYSTALWMGYDNPKEMEGVAGGNKPCEMWTDFMDNLHEQMGLHKKEFNMPSTVMLSNIYGELQKPSYNDNIYSSRPEGWDYVSMIIEEKRKEEKKNEEIKEVEKKAKEAVDEYEQFQITTVQEAQMVDELYNNAFMLADSVEDSKLREELLERIAYKYQLMSGELEQKWNDAIEAYKRTQQAKTDEENAYAATLSEEEAEKAEMNAKIAYVDCYINLINLQTQYFDTIETWIVAAENGLAECEIYQEEHQRLAEALDSAILRIRDIQTNEIANMSTINENTREESYENKEEDEMEGIQEDIGENEEENEEEGEEE